MSTLRLNIFKTAAPIHISFCLHSYICLSYLNPRFQAKIPILKNGIFFQIISPSIMYYLLLVNLRSPKRMLVLVLVSSMKMTPEPEIFKLQVQDKLQQAETESKMSGSGKWWLYYPYRVVLESLYLNI
jgi:hypothetical protein